MDHVVRSQGAGEDANQGQATDVRVAGGADDLGDQRPVGIARRRGQRRAHRAVCGGRWSAGRRGEALLDDLEHLFETRHRSRGRSGPAGRSRLGHRGLEVLDDRLGRDVLALEVAVEEGVVLGLLDDRLDERPATVLDGGGLVAVGVPLHARPVRRVEHPLAEQPHRPDDDLLGVVDGQVERLRVAERPLAARDGVVVVRARDVELAHRDRPRDADRGQLLPQQRGRAVDVVGCRDDEDRRVSRSEPRAQLADEVGEPRGVDEVDGHAVALERGDGQPDRPVALALLGTSPRDAGRDEMVEQRGLTGSARTDEDDVADVLGGPGLGRRG